MEHKDTDNFDIDFTTKNSSSEEDSEIQFMNFTLSKSAHPEEDAEADDFFSKMDQMSIFDLAQDAPEQEESPEPEEVAVEPVSDLEEIEELLPETLSEISEEPLPDPDDIEINIVNWNGPRKVEEFPAYKPVFVDDTKDADGSEAVAAMPEPEPVAEAAEEDVTVPEVQEPGHADEPAYDDDIEIKFRHFRKNTQQRAERTAERQKKNGGA